MTSFLSDLRIYTGRIRQFQRRDWAVYLAWVGLLSGLCFATLGFLLVGLARGARFPAEAWLVPSGAAVFTVAAALDAIGHRTIYKEEIRRAEGLVHAVTIFCGIASCVLLCAAYGGGRAASIPAAVLTGLSLLYSLVDEAFHWKRYVSAHSDRVEMWSHVGILAGHITMMAAWWAWLLGGYQGVAAAVA
ncbi:MAG TPA: hypothetical protein VH083_16630 [Myxococcales bacterium]|jgi:hypothetical protein|nr:hypothetical protein [Myxococcales bacterium]